MNALAGLMNPGAVGQTLRNEFEQGQQKRQQIDGNNAMTAYALNPNDPKAFEAIARTNPQAAMEIRQHQQQAQLASDGERKKLFARAAKAAKTPQQWDTIIDHLSQQFPEAQQFKGKFSPELRQAYMVAGGEVDEADKPSLTVIDGVAFDSRTGQPLFESPYDKIVSGPGGIYQQPRIGFGRGGQGAAPQGHAVAGPEIAPGWQLVDEDDGGPTPQASGSFLSSGN